MCKTQIHNSGFMLVSKNNSQTIVLQKLRFDNQYILRYELRTVSDIGLDEVDGQYIPLAMREIIFLNSNEDYTCFRSMEVQYNYATIIPHNITKEYLTSLNISHLRLTFTSENKQTIHLSNDDRENVEKICVKYFT